MDGYPDGSFGLGNYINVVDAWMETGLDYSITRGEMAEFVRGVW
jgi:hypothetical protein